MTDTTSPFYSLMITHRLLCVVRLDNSSFFVGVTDTYCCATALPLEGFLSTFSLPYHNLSEWSCQPHFEFLFLALSLPQQSISVSAHVHLGGLSPTVGTLSASEWTSGTFRAALFTQWASPLFFVF